MYIYWIIIYTLNYMPWSVWSLIDTWVNGSFLSVTDLHFLIKLWVFNTFEKCLCVSQFYTCRHFAMLLSFYGTKILRTALLVGINELHKNAYHFFALQIDTFQMVYQTCILMYIFDIAFKTIDASSLLKIVNNYCMRVVENRFEKKIHLLKRTRPSCLSDRQYGL